MANIRKFPTTMKFDGKECVFVCEKASNGTWMTGYFEPVDEEWKLKVLSNTRGGALSGLNESMARKLDEDMETVIDDLGYASVKAEYSKRENNRRIKQMTRSCTVDEKIDPEKVGEDIDKKVKNLKDKSMR